MLVGVVGINHKLADLKLRERLALVCERRFGPGSLTPPDRGYLLLSTCNRTEIYFSADKLSETQTEILSILRSEISGEFDQKLYSYFGSDCFLHLCRVVSGLDSAIVAETEIQGQVKIAYEKASRYGRLTRELHYLFQKGLKVGKSLRTKLPLERGVPDLEHAILTTGRHLFSGVEQSRILFVGASDINLKILQFLKSKGIGEISLCNRTGETAQECAEKYRVKAISWEGLLEWDRFDWVIFGTKSPRYLIGKEPSPPNGQKLVIDLCVPRNVDPKLARSPNVALLNIDQINRMLKIRRKQMTQFLTQAEGIVESAAQKQVDIFQEKEKSRNRYIA